MFWQLTLDSAESQTHSSPPDGRYVLHRHCDDRGPHLDLRLEQNGYLTGWRIEGTKLEGSPWAIEKRPHPLRWLEQDGNAERLDCGEYAWLEQSNDRRVVVIRGRHGCRVVQADRAPSLPLHTVRAVVDILREYNAPMDDAARLIRDGVTARSRAIARLCGLGRELEGDHFDEAIWRKALNGLTLDEVHQQLRSFERRFDTAFPPTPVTRPERLDAESVERVAGAMSIARSV
ncbi:MAG: hypothetical protein AMXMBFR84_29290 [Candidatus Hydrogenedentota bacterium]